MRFRVTIQQSAGETIELHDSLGQWQRYEELEMPGFSGTSCLDLSSLWRNFFDSDFRRSESTVIGYETIVKFGDVIQLKTNLVIVIELDE
jgi:hypothetical protein